jgi:hypothetical protein
MKDSSSLHLKVQQLCDCFMNTEPLKEMSILKGDADKEEAALKWLSLAILYGIDSNAKKITMSATKDGGVKVVAKYRATELPSPGSEVGAKILDAIKAIAHFDEGAGKTPLAVGIRDSSIEIGVETFNEDEGGTVVLKFPK